MLGLLWQWYGCGDLTSLKEWFNIIGWWLLGLSTEYGMWLVVSSSHDLLTIFNERPTLSTVRTNNGTDLRYCNELSSGITLIADAGPALVVSSIFPLFPSKGFYLYIRVVIIIVIAVCSFILIALDISWTLTLTGISLACLYVAIAYTTFFSYIDCFNNSRLITAWSSGIGASGFFASLIYAVLRDWDVSISEIVYYSLSVPAIMLFSFWILLSKPSLGDTSKFNSLDEVSEPKLSFHEKIRIAFRVLVKYSIPMGLIFFLEFTLNQGLFELIVFNANVISLKSRVRWFTFLYLASNLIFRTSGYWIRTERVWLLVMLQAFNLILMMTQAIYGWIGTGYFGFCMVILIVFWEGAVGGLGYVNVFIMIHKEKQSSVRNIAVVMTVFVEELSILLSGICTIPLHDFICSIKLN